VTIAMFDAVEHQPRSTLATADKVGGRSARIVREIGTAREWFARRRVNANAAETVFAVFDRTAGSIPPIGERLSELGFEHALTRVGVNTADGSRQIPLSCFRSVDNADHEISLYALNTDLTLSASSGTVRELAQIAARHLLPIYAAADVLIVCLEDADQLSDTADLADLDALESLIEMNEASDRRIFIVNPQSSALRLAVDARLAKLETSYERCLRVINVASNSEAPFNKAIDKIFELLDNNLSALGSPISRGDDLQSETISGQSSIDREIERVCYEAIVTLDARRVLIFDAGQTLFATDDAVDPMRDCSADDDHFKLQLAGLPLHDLQSLTLRLDDMFYSLQALSDSDTLFVALISYANVGAAEAHRRSERIAQTLRDTFATLATTGAH
jgi:hypothetical protein